MQTERNIWLRVLSMILTLALLISCIPNQVYAMAGEALAELLEREETAETIETPNETKRGVYEVTERREANVKHFALEDGTYTAVMYGGAVHTQDAEGNWQDIDNRLSESGSEFSTSNARIKFAKQIPGNEMLFTLHDGNRKITMSLDNATKKTAGVVTNHSTEFDSEATQLQKLMTLDNLSSEILYADILDGVDLQYVVESLNVKENIIVKERRDSYQYTFTIALNNLEAEMAEDGSVRIYDPDTKETVYNIPAGFMYDANGEYSTAVVYTLTNGGNGKYSLTVTADAAWINAEERAFPVVIDPTISTEHATSAYSATIIKISNPSFPKGNLNFLEVGSDSIAYWKMNTLPTLPADHYITDASFAANKTTTNSTGFDLEMSAHKVISDWNVNSFSYSQHVNYGVGEYVEYATDAKTGTNQDVQYTLDITQIVREWYNDPSHNYGIAFRGISTSALDYYYYRFDVGSTARPVCITYKSIRGIESYWSYATQSVGRAGTGYVNKATGELTFAIGTVSTVDALFGKTVSLIYNQDFAGNYVNGYVASIPFTNPTAGYGFKLDINEYLVSNTYVDADGSNKTYYTWMDSDGTEHDFYPDGDSTTIYKDDDGMLLTLTHQGGQYTIEDLNHNIRVFKSASSYSNQLRTGAILESITDKNGNRLTYRCNDESNKARVTDILITPNSSSTITYLKIHYNDYGQIKLIENAGVENAPKVYFFYAYYDYEMLSIENEGYLRGIQFVNNEQVFATTTYEYDSNGKLIAANDNLSDYSVRYTYSGNRVTAITEYAGANDTQGQTITFSYGDGYTEIRTSGSDEQYGTDDDLITVYIFDEFGRVISTYSTDVNRTTIYGASSGEYEEQENVKNNIKSTATVGGSASNYLVNGGFEKLNVAGTAADGWYTEGNITYGNSGSKEYDHYSAAFSLLRNSSDKLRQRVFLPEGNYTLSADVYTSNATNVEAYLTASTVIGTQRSYSVEIPMDETDVVLGWTNVSLNFEVQNSNNSGGEYFEITIQANCPDVASNNTRTLLVDNVMLEKGIGQSGYSMVEFGNFEDYSVGWVSVAKKTYSNYWQTDSNVVYENELLGSVLKVDPSVENDEIKAIQTIYKAVAGKEDRFPKSFILSGMAKGTQQYASGDFYLQLYVLYADGENDTEEIKFQNDCNTWQFTSKTFTTKEKAIAQIDLRIVYNNPGVAYFDNIYVTQVLDDFTVTTEYDEEGRVIEQSNGFKSVWYQYGEDNKVQVMYNSDNELYLYTYEGNLLKQEEYSIVTNPNWEYFTWESKDIRSITQYAYNDFGQMTSRAVYQGSPYGVRPTTPYVSESYTYETTPGSRIIGTLLSASTNPKNTTRYFYDTITGQLLAEVCPEQQTGTCYTYNLDGTLSTAMPATYTTATGWNPVTDQQSVSYSYYDSNLLKSITTESTTFTFLYNAFGNAEFVKVGSVEIVAYEYYSNNGKLRNVQYGNGVTVEYVYDELDRVSEVWYTVDGERTKVYTYSYTAYGQLYRFDNLLTGKTLIYHYDGNQRLTGHVEYNTADMTIDFSANVGYDEQSRVETVGYTFDYRTNQGNYVDANLEYTYGYSDEGQISQFTLNANGDDHDFSYFYNHNGWLRRKIVNSNTGFQNSVVYDFYSAGTREYSWVENYTSTMQDGSSTNYRFRYDSRGNITEVYIDMDRWCRYVYDKAGQLIREDNSYSAETYIYTYDKAGNILSRQHYPLTNEGEEPTGMLYSYDYEYLAYDWGDLLTSYMGQSLYYDGIGNPISYYNGIRWNFTWTEGRRLATASNGGTTVSFMYNDEGIRTSKTVNGVKHTYYLNGSQIVMEEWGNELLVYLYDAEGSPIGMQYRTSSFAEGVFETYWFEKNLQGDIVAVYDDRGVMQISYVYDAWGNFTTTFHDECTYSDNVALNPFLYRGYYYDAELGMYYLQSRYYDPTIGRYINADGYISTGQGLLGYNMFAYCGNNPVNRVDPEGKSWIAVAILVALCAVFLTGCDTSVGAAPDYVEIAESDGDRSKNPNCYSYVIGEYGKSYEPGEFSNTDMGMSVDSVAAAVAADMEALGRGCRTLKRYDSPIEDNEYRIAVRVHGPEQVWTMSGLAVLFDYHFMVQTDSGGWAEKQGSRGATRFYSTKNPAKISWDSDGMEGYYDSEIIYLAITR